MIRAVLFSSLWWFVLSESEGELPRKNSCQKFSLPYDKVEFYEYLSSFLEKDEFEPTKSTTEFCDGNEVSVPNDIDGIKSLAKNLENILKDVKERMIKMDIDIEEIKEHVGLKKAIGNTQDKDIEEIKEQVGLKKGIDLASCASGGGFTRTSFGCFWVSEEKMKHEDAKQHCLSLGMDLASLEHLRSQTELDKLSSELKFKKWATYVIGLKQDQPGGKWRWSSGAEMPGNSPLWYPGEPNNAGGGQHWGFFRGGGGLDDAENDAAPFICSMPQSHKP